MAGVGLLHRRDHLLHSHRHHSVWLRRVPHWPVRAVAVRLHRRRQAGRPSRRADRQRHLADLVRHLAGDRARDHRHRDGDHDHRHPAGAGEPQADPRLATTAGQGDRAQRHGRWPGGSTGMTATDLGLPSMRRAVVSAAPSTGPLVDTFGRAATDLRVSLTDRCNLRCTYCMPAEGLNWLPGDDLLSASELARLLGIAVKRLGITSVRFTGGEPLVSRHLDEVVAAAAALTPRPEIAMTTNGIGLARRAAGLKAA